MKKNSVSKKDMPAGRLIAFKLIAVIVPLVALLTIELVLRVTGYGNNFNLFVQNSRDGYENYMMVNPEVGKKYFQELEYTAPANDIFLKKKPKNTFRVFVMGSSTVFGFPYDRNLMFSRILHRQLEDTWPDKKIEVVNTAITAINSFTLLDFTDQIIKYEPDAVLIYAGHNEFYGAFGIGSNETMTKYRGVARLHLSLLDLRIYQMVRNLIAGASEKLVAGDREATQGTLMKRMVARKDLTLDSEEYALTMKRYRQNMGKMLEKFQDKQVHVFLSELVSNVKGMEPFHSVASGTHEAAIDVYRKAQMAENRGEFETALELYYKAKDLDCIRFRASEEINSIVEELSEEYQATKVPMMEWFQGNSENRLIGNNLMTEHVHPNIEGNFIMAEAFFSELVNSGVAGEQVPNKDYNRSYIKRNWGYTELDSLLAHHRVQLLKGFWPFVKEGNKEYNYKAVYRPKSYIDSLSFAVLVNPDQALADVRLDLARKYEKSGRYDKAYKEYEALLRTNPYIAVNYRDAANCLLQLGDLPLALRYYERSLEFEESFFATFRIAEIFLLKGDYENAIRNFEKSFALSPDDKKVNVLAKSYVSFVYANKKEQAKAAAAELKRVNAVRSLDVPPKKYVYDLYIPYQTKAEVQKAKALMKENNYDEALKLLETSLEMYDSHIANRLIGDICFKQNDLKKALNYYNKVFDQFKFDVQFLNHLALIHLKNGDKSQAAKYVQEIRIIEPDYEHLKMLSLIIPAE
jgi:tetratricopeptide (TPR) repeat protein